MPGEDTILAPETRAAVIDHILRYELYRHRRLVRRISELAGEKQLGDTVRNANTWETVFFLLRSWLEGKVPTASEVFLATGLSKGTATTCLNRLEMAGVIHRTEGTDDRRQRFIHLNDAYARLLEEFIVDCHEDFQRLSMPAPPQPVAAGDGAHNHDDAAFMAYLSHDLRAPLNAIIGYSEAIKGEMLGRLRPTGYIEYASDIHVAARRLSDLIDDLIDLSQFEVTGTMPIQPERLDVPGMIKRCRQAVSADAKVKNIQLQSRIATDLPIVAGDPGRIERAVFNLLSAAVRFTPGSGDVTIEVRERSRPPKPAQVEFIVSDTGPGFPEAGAGAPTNPFQRLDPTGRFAETGTGLGLAIAKSIAEAHGGSLDLTPLPGEGTRATLSLPADDG